LNVSDWPADLSRSVIVSPARSFSSPAAVAGSAAGIGVPADCGASPGHVPDTRTACAAIPSSAAASSTGVFLPAPAGRAGWAPGTRLSGLDQMPCQKPNGTPGSAKPIADRRALVVADTVVPEKDPPAVSAVPGAVTRSCRTAWGSDWPPKAASAAAAAAATNVVRAAAAMTTQRAVARRAGNGPRGVSTQARIPYRPAVVNGWGLARYMP
jgi:hypothetical protein